MKFFIHFMNGLYNLHKTQLPLRGIYESCKAHFASLVTATSLQSFCMVKPSAMGFVDIGPMLSFTSHGPSSSEACDFMVYLLQKIFKRIQFWFFVWWKSSFSLPCTFTWKLISVMVRDSNPSTMIRLFWQLDNNSFISNYWCWIMCEVKLEAVKFTKHKDLSRFLLFIFVLWYLVDTLWVSQKKSAKSGCLTHMSGHYIFQNAHPLQRKNFNLSNGLQLLYENQPMSSCNMLFSF